MRNSRVGPGAVRSAGTVGAPPASARLLQEKAREWRAGPKNRPFRQREIAAYPSSASGDPTPKRGATIRRVSVEVAREEPGLPDLQFTDARQCAHLRGGSAWPLAAPPERSPDQN